MTISNEFEVPLLDRQPHGGSIMDMTTFIKSTAQTKELVATNNNAGAVMFIDNLGWVRIGACPDYMHEGGDDYGLVNLSNTELNVARVGMETTMSFITLEARADLHPKAVHGDDVSNDVRGNALPGKTRVTAGVLSMVVVIPKGKKWIEGHCSNRGVQEEITSEYGEAVGQWVKAAASAIENQVAIADVVSRAKKVDPQNPAVGLKALFGDDFPLLDIHYGTPMIPVTPLTATTHADDVDRRRMKLGPYKSVAAVSPAPPAPRGSSNGIDADTLARIVTSKEDRREAEVMKDGQAVVTGIFMAAKNLDMEKGTLGDLVFP